MYIRFDGVGNQVAKVNPVLRKTTSTSDMLIQILLACASGDLLMIRR